MKKAIIILLVLCLALPLFAEGQKDSGKVVITVAGLPKHPHYDAIAKAFQEANPSVVVRPISYNIGDGSTLALDALIASGSYPNVLADFTGRVGKYAIQSDKPGAWSALDMTPYLGADIVNFYDLSTFKRNGKLLMVPETSPAQGMALNADLLAKAGYTLPGPDNWTIAEFEKMAEAVKKIGAYPTILFAKNQSADYLWMNWFGSFGASKVLELGPGALATLKYFDKLYKNGWIPKEAPEIFDDLALEQYFAKGIVAAMPIRAEWIAGYIQMGVDGKLIDKPFNVVMYPFPKAPGVKAVPSIGTGNTYVVCETGNKAVDAVAGSFVAFAVSKTWIEDSVNNAKSGYPVRKDVSLKATAEPLGSWQAAVTKIIATAGMMDPGYTLAGYADIRAALFPLLQGMWTGQLTPDQVYEKYQAAIKAALSK